MAPYKKGKKSIVWEFFRYSNKGVSREVYCDICDFRTTVPATSSTSNMLGHVRSCHPMELEYIENLLKDIAKQEDAVKSELSSVEDADGLVEKSEDNLDWNQENNEELSLNKRRSTKVPRSNENTVRVTLHQMAIDKIKQLNSKSKFNTRKSVRGLKQKKVLNKGDDRKLDSGGLMSGIYPPGLSEASTGSGDNAGCDDVSVPLSPEQFLSEETEQGGSPHTPTVQRPESYKLRHNNHLTLVLESLAGDESFMDVTLTAQGKAIKAHKSVLSAVSPYFRSVLKENPCQHPIIIMPRDIRFEELNNIISYVYKGEMTVAAEDLSSLLKTAEILQVTGLSPSDTGSGSGGIMSQMQGLPASMYPSSLPKRSSKQKHQAQQQQHYQQQQQHQQEQLRHAQRQQQEQMDQDDQPMNDDVSDAHERVDPLEFLNTDMTCVKEEIESDNDDGEDSSLPLSVDASGSNNISEPLAISDSSNSSSTRRKSTTGSPKPLEDITSKPFNPGEPGVSSAADESFSESVPSSVPYMCPHCLEVQRPLDILQSHLRLKHPTKPSFVCPCGRVFGRQSLLAEHARKCKF